MTPSDPPPANDKPKDQGRDAKGKFTKGNHGGPGNPYARRVAKLRQLLLSAVTDEVLGSIVEKLIDMAKGGDLAAIKLVLAYSIGKPGPCVDPDRLEEDELD